MCGGGGGEWKKIGSGSFLPGHFPLCLQTFPLALKTQNAMRKSKYWGSIMKYQYRKFLQITTILFRSVFQSLPKSFSNIQGKWTKVLAHPLLWNRKRHFQNCCNRDGNTIFKYMNYVSIVVATDLEVHFSVLKKGVSQYFCLYSVCTSHWCLVMSFWLKVCIYSHTRGVKLGLGKNKMASYMFVIPIYIYFSVIEVLL